MAKKTKNKPLSRWNSPAAQPREGCVRIIGGKYRGRQLAYSGDRRTRPMQDHVREAVFNLVGAWIRDKYVIDLFAGTGAVGLEAISRGASHAVMIERHIPTAKLIRSNAESLGVTEKTTIAHSDTFFWVRKFIAEDSDRPTQPWAIFCSPPYAFYLERRDEMLELISGLLEAAPEDSLFVVEADSRFPTRTLPQPERWHERHYSPAVICYIRPDADPISQEQ